MRWCIAGKTARIAGAATAALGATLLLASCSLPAAVAGAPASSGAVVDPSVTSPAASSTPDATAAAATPAPAPTESSVVVTPSPAAATLAAVTPFITSPSSGAKVTGDLDVSAIVPKVVESGGTCTLVATKGSAQRTDRAKAVAASSYTGCEPMTLTDLAAGTWSITVRYTSDESAGTSAAVRVTAG